MKQFISKIKNLSQKAAEVQTALRQLPPKVAEVREAVAATTGQLQQLKTQIHHSVADLKAEQEGHLAAALEELYASADVFAKAGFALSGVDLEISPVQRLLVHLTKTGEVHASVLRGLASAHEQRRTTKAILSSLLQAQQLAATVELGALAHNEVIVGVGPIPSVRLCWRAPESAVATAAGPPALPALPVPSPVATPPSAFGQGAFFERRPSPPPAATALVTATVAAATAASAVVPTATPSAEKSPAVKTPPAAASGVKADPLARFKQMPGFSKYKK